MEYSGNHSRPAPAHLERSIRVGTTTPCPSMRVLWLQRTHPGPSYSGLKGSEEIWWTRETSMGAHHGGSPTQDTGPLPQVPSRRACRTSDDTTLVTFTKIVRC